MKRPTVLVAALFAAAGLAAADQPKADDPGTSLGVASLPNLRDVGGHKTRDGRVVRTGLLYRSGQLVRVAPADRGKVAALGLKTDYDLRTAAERGSAPDELPPGVRAVGLDVLADSKRDDAARIPKLLQKPAEANAELGGGKAEAIFAAYYRDFVSLPSARRELGRLFAELGRGENLPAVVHCTSGKDRSGWAAAALLTLLGVPEEAVLADFLRSNDAVLPAYRRSIDAFAGAGGDPAVMRAVLGVRPEYLGAALGEVKTRYGTIEGYFGKGLGIDAAGQKTLRDRFLAPG